MDKNNFPPLDRENPLPDIFEDIPERMEPLEDYPVIEELSFGPETSVPEIEELPQEAPLPESGFPEPDIAKTGIVQPLPEEGVLPEALPFEEAVPAEERFIDDSLSPVPTEPEIPAESDSQEPSGMAVLPEEPPVAAEMAADVPEENPAPLFSPVEDIPDQEYRDNGAEFETLMNAAPQQEPEKTVLFSASSGNYKGRPKRKIGEGLLGIPSILATFVWLALIVIIGVTAGRMLWICAADVLAFGREDKVVTVTVYEADTMEDIIEKLHAGGLIRYKSLFSLYADISDAEEDIKPGIYDLNTRYDYHALVNFMSPRSSREVVKLTIPEGYTCRQIFSLLEENRICTAVDAAAYASGGELSEYWFLEGVERGTDNCLEGYLFPDTYEFYKNSTPREAIEKMLDNFEHRFDEDMISQLETLNRKVTDGDYGVREIVIIASLIEKESAAPGESPMVSGVIYNRLFRWGNNRPLLNIDATIVYAQEGNNARIDTKLDHPYNTYLYEGLTPGPIANPGLSSLKAALNPESHNYYYYVLNPSTGMHQFSTTYQEHQAYVQEFNAAPEIEIE